MQESNLPKANYEFAASSARPTLGRIKLYISLKFYIVYREPLIASPPATTMRIDPMTAFTFLFLSLMAGATVVSGLWGYTLGRSALQGITQPDMRPNRLEEDSRSSKREKMVFVSEEAILEDITARMNGTATPLPQ